MPTELSSISSPPGRATEKANWAVSRFASFEFGAEPVVNVEANYSKRRRRDNQALHPTLAGLLERWLESKQPADGELLFPISARAGGVERKTSKMMRLDLARAREKWLSEATSEDELETRRNSDFLTYKDSHGRFADFHSNRHTFVTLLGRAGVAPKTMQSLARHSTIDLTLNVYSHTSMVEKRSAIGRLGNIWECSGSKSGTDSDNWGHTPAQEHNEEGEGDGPDDSRETLGESQLGNNSQKETERIQSEVAGARTQDLRIKSPKKDKDRSQFWGTYRPCKLL